MWNFRSDRPIYLQLMEHLRLLIVCGDYKPGDRLPSVRELAEEAAVNPNTVQKALAELERSGIIHTQRTNGRFITEDAEKIKQAREQLAGEQIQEFLLKMKSLGYEPDEIPELIQSFRQCQTSD